jgi:hypothetical protein
LKTVKLLGVADTGRASNEGIAALAQPRRQESRCGVAAKRARRKDMVDILRERLKLGLQIVVNRRHHFVEPSTH